MPNDLLDSTGVPPSASAVTPSVTIPLTPLHTFQASMPIPIPIPIPVATQHAVHLGVGECGMTHSLKSFEAFLRRQRTEARSSLPSADLSPVSEPLYNRPLP